MNKLLVLLISSSIILACNKKQEKQLNEDDLKTFFIEKMQRIDSTFEVLSFRVERVDTMTEKVKNEACLRVYQSYLKFLQSDSMETGLGAFWNFITDALNSNLKRYLQFKMDSVGKLIPASDTLKPAVYNALCKYHISNDIGNRIGSTWILVTLDLKPVDEDDFYGVNEIFDNGGMYWKK